MTEKEELPKIGEKMLWLSDEESRSGVTCNGYPLDEWEAMTDLERNKVRAKMLEDFKGFGIE